MKNFFLAFMGVFVFFSCESSKVVDSNGNNQEKIWEKGTFTVTGKITEVSEDKDSQVVILRDRNDVEYICIITSSKLSDNSAPYRVFKIGETITFRGEIEKENQVLVYEILENY